MFDLLPAVTLRWTWYHGFFPNVDCDLLGLDSFLDVTGLWVLTTATEESWRFDAEVPNLLLASIPLAIEVWSLYFILFSLESFLLRLR